MSPRPPATPKKARSIFAGLPTPLTTPSTSPSSSSSSSFGNHRSPVTPTSTRNSGASRRGLSAWSTPKTQTRVLKPKTPRSAPPPSRPVDMQLETAKEDVRETPSTESKSPAKTQPSMRDDELQISHWAMFSRVHHARWPPAEDLAPVAKMKNRKRKLAARRERKEWRQVFGRACVDLEAAEAVAPLLELAPAPKKIRDGNL